MESDEIQGLHLRHETVQNSWVSLRRCIITNTKNVAKSESEMAELFGYANNLSNEVKPIFYTNDLF